MGQEREMVDSPYLAKLSRIEPEIAAVEDSAFYVPAATSLKRIADALDEFLKWPRTNQMSDVVKASIGRIVHYYESDHEMPVGAGGDGRHWPGTNGTRWHPAVITRVWTDDCVNLLVFLDAHGTVVRTSMSRLPNEVFAEGVHCANSGWRWPPRA